MRRISPLTIGLALAVGLVLVGPSTSAEAAVSRWQTVYKWKGAKVQACRRTHDGWSDLGLRLVNNSDGLRRARAWSIDTYYDTHWGNRRTSRWIGAHRKSGWFWNEGSNEAPRYMKGRVRIFTKAGASKIRVFSWKNVTMKCAPGAGP